MGEAIWIWGWGSVGLNGLLLCDLFKFPRPGEQQIQAGLPHGRLLEDW